MSARLKGTWDDPAIQTDPRIDTADPAIRAAAEFLHNNESMHLHNYVESTICPYCALRATRAVAVFRRESGVVA